MISLPMSWHSSTIELTIFALHVVLIDVANQLHVELHELGLELREAGHPA